MRITNELQLDFDDVLILPKRSKLSSRKQAHLDREFVFPHSPRDIECVPVMAANMDTTGSLYMADTMGFNHAITCLHKHYTVEDYIKFYTNNKHNNNLTFYSTGISKNDIEKMTAVFTALSDARAQTPNICVDIANGYSSKFVDTIKKIRETRLFRNSVIMAGNVVTANMTEELILYAGADIVKVGIGSGSVCTTRLKTGIGRPQLSAVIDCAAAAHSVGGHVCSDGGCKTPADVCKAFCAGADFVMLGSMLAGTNECDGEWEYEYKCETIPDRPDLNKVWWQSVNPGYPTETRKKALKFYGMSSKEAQDKHNDGVKDYRTSEGRCVSIPYKGQAQEVLNDIFGGVRSCCTYIGAFQIKDLPKNTNFIRVNNTHNRIYEK